MRSRRTSVVASLIAGGLVAAALVGAAPSTGASPSTSGATGPGEVVVTVRIADGADGTVRAGVDVLVASPRFSRSGQTGADGTIAFDDLPLGEAIVTAWLPGHDAELSTLTVVAEPESWQNTTWVTLVPVGLVDLTVMQNGRSVPDAPLMLLRDGYYDSTVRTDPAGRVRVALQPGDYAVQLAGDDGRGGPVPWDGNPVSAPFTVGIGFDSPTVTIAPTGVLEVAVTTIDGRPAIGADVMIAAADRGRNDDYSWAATGPDGVARFVSLLPGEYVVWTNLDGADVPYGGRPILSTPYDEIVGTPIAVGTDRVAVSLALDPADFLTLTGRVTDHDGTPLPGRWVGATTADPTAGGTARSTTMTDRDGRYSLRTLVTSENWHVGLGSDEGWEPLAHTATGTIGGATSVVADLTVPDGAELSGRVVSGTVADPSGESGGPGVPDAHVDLTFTAADGSFLASYGTRTDADGYFHFPAVDGAARYDATIQRWGSMPWFNRMDRQEFRPGDEIPHALGGRVSGTITDGTDAASSIRGVIVGTSWEFSRFTAHDGRYVAGVLPAGDYLAVVQSPWARPQLQPMRVTTGTTTGTPIVLAGSTASGTVTAGGIPLGGAEVELASPGGAPFNRAITGTDGRYAVVGALPERVEVSVRVAGIAVGSGIGRLDPDGSLRLDLDADGLESLVRFRLVDADGSHPVGWVTAEIDGRTVSEAAIRDGIAQFVALEGDVRFRLTTDGAHASGVLTADGALVRPSDEETIAVVTGRTYAEIDVTVPRILDPLLSATIVPSDTPDGLLDIVVAVAGTGRPVGDVTAAADGVPPLRGTLDAFGRATLPIPSGIADGTHRYTVTYTGDDRHRPSEIDLVVSVSRDDDGVDGVDLLLDVATATPGQEIAATVTGLAPGGAVRLFVYSQPQRVASLTADATGRAVAALTVPADLDPGMHRIEARTPQGVVSRSIRVIAAGDPLAATGRELPGEPFLGAVLLAVVGLALVRLRRPSGRPS